MNTEHPITSPPEMVQQWLGTYFGTTVTGEVSGVELALATQAAQWNADQELEACCEWIPKLTPWDADQLRAARRPKPPSLKEQALSLVPESGGISMRRSYSPNELLTIRAALEALPND